jgi:hypothetical protein
MSFSSACESWEAVERLRVRYETFGHLDPKIGTSNTGYFEFIKGGYQAVDGQPITSKFPNCHGPDFYEAMTDYIFELCRYNKTNSLPEGIYRWTGTCKAFKNGKIGFVKGRLTLIREIE